MVIDESTAKAAIKKQIKVYQRRRKTIDAEKIIAKKSRKLWVKRIINTFKKTSLIVGAFQENKLNTSLIVLIPENNSFKSRMIEIDAKKMDININEISINITNHFFVRLMQSRKTIQFEKLIVDVNRVLKLLMVVSNDVILRHNCKDYGIYADKLGFIPVIYDIHNHHCDVVIKTIIPPEAMGLKHLNQYSDLDGTGNYKLVSTV